MPTRMMRLRLDIGSKGDAALHKELTEISRACARIATWLMQRYRAADGVPPRLPAPLPVFASGKKKGRVDWAKALGPPPESKLSTPLYKELREAFPEISSAMVSYLCHVVNADYRHKRFAIITGRSRTPEFRDLHPIPVRDRCARLIPDDRPGGYVLEATIYSTKAERSPRITIPLWGSVEWLSANQREAIEQYAEAGKMPRALIHFSGNRKRKRWYVSIPYEAMAGDDTLRLFDDRTLIVRRPPKGNGFLRCTLERPRGRPWTIDLPWAEAWAAIDKTQAVRASMQHKYGHAVPESGVVGHGRKRATECFTTQRRRTLNRQRTFNYTTARRIIQVAEKWKCGRIAFEDLGQLPKDMRDMLVLGDWSYYQIKERLAALCSDRHKKCAILLQIVMPPEMILESLGDKNDGEETEERVTSSVTQCE